MAPIQIIYGTATGNSEVLAKEATAQLKKAGLAVKLKSMDKVNTEVLYQTETLLIIVSTDSGGVPPFMADDFYNFLKNKATADLQHLSYSVLALGDSYYPDFCQTGKDFDHMLEELGAGRIVERVDCDIDFWDDFDRWFDDVCSVLTKTRKVVNG